MPDTALAAEPLVFASWEPGVLPARTIVYEVADWCATWLVQPDGPDAGDPWEFTDQQLMLLAHWFAHDADGRWVNRRGTVRMMKGWGKDPLVAVLALVELCGPAYFSPRERRAVRRRAAWVDIAAVSRDQTRTTMRLIAPLLPKSTIREFDIDVNKEIVYASGGRGTIQAVTSSPLSLEGGRATLAIRNETQYWKSSNEGHAMAEVIDGNLAKSRDGSARALSVCNAHIPGQDSVGEREWDAWQAIQQGRTRVHDVLYYAVEAPPQTDLTDGESLRAGIVAARGDATWIDPDRMVAEVWDPRTQPTEARRKYLNQIKAAEDAWLAPHEWRSCEYAGREDDEPGALLEGTTVTLGFDGSKSDDHTGLVATRVADGCAFVLGHWDPEQTGGGEIDREAVDAEVAHAFERLDVVAFYSDLHPFESYVDAWAKEFGAIDRREGLCVGATQKHPIAWDMRSRRKEFARAAERFQAEVADGVVRYAPHAALTEHALNARRRSGREGVTFGKEPRESKRAVDLLAAAVLSRLARADYLALPESKQRRRRTGRAMFV